MARVVVLGASGQMGSRVCRLAREHPGVEVIDASRSGARGKRVYVSDRASLERVIRAGDLVVNCVGPFRYDPGPVVGACVSAGAHYCDLCDDAAFSAAVRAAALRSAAAAAGVAVVPGASTLPGLLALFARGLARTTSAPPARFAAYLCVGSRNPVSAALLASLLGPLGRRRGAGPRWFADARDFAASDGRRLRCASYPSALAEDELAIGARRIPVSFSFGFDRAALTRGLELAAPLLGRLPAGALAPLARALLPFARLARLGGTPQGLFAVVAEDAAGRELARIEIAASADGLDIPAAPPAWIAARLARGEALPAGARELAELVPLDAALDWLAARPNVRVRFSY